MLLSKVLPKPIPGTAVRVYLIRHGETHWNRRGKIQGGGYDVPLNATGKEQAMRAASALEGIPLDVVASSSLSRAKETADILLEHHCISSSSNNSGNNNNNNNKKPMRIVDGGFNEMRFGKFEGLGYRKNKEDITKEGDGNINDESLNESRLAIFLVAKSKVAKDREFCFPSRGDISDNDNDDEIYWRINADDETFRIENDSGKGESTRNVEDRALEALSKAITRVLENDKDPNTTTTTTTTTTKHVAIVSHGRTNKVMISAMISAKDKIGQGNTSINVLDHPGLEVGGDVDGDGYMKGWTARLLNYTDHVEEK
jgi:broad specificity phosphatase PhoE